MPTPRRWDHTVAWLAVALLATGAAGSLYFAGHEIWAALASQGVWIGLALGLASALPARLGDSLGLGPGRLGPVSLGICGVAVLAVSDGLSQILMALSLRDTGSLGEVDQLIATSSEPAFLGALLSLGLAPGIAEELLFRGALQRPLVARLGRGAGIVVAAALFAVAHFDPVHSAAAFGLGLCLGAIASLAGSTRAAMGCHAANNLAALVGARFGGPAFPLAPAWAGPLLLALGVALLAGVWWRQSHGGVGSRPGSGGSAAAGGLGESGFPQGEDRPGGPGAEGGPGARP